MNARVHFINVPDQGSLAIRFFEKKISPVSMLRDNQQLLLPYLNCLYLSQVLAKPTP